MSSSDLSAVAFVDEEHVRITFDPESDRSRFSLVEFGSELANEIGTFDLVDGDEIALEQFPEATDSVLSGQQFGTDRSRNGDRFEL